MNEKLPIQQNFKSEKTPGEKFLENKYLTAGHTIKLAKIFNPEEVIEGTLDEDVALGNPIVLDHGSKNTDPIKDVTYTNNKIFFKTNNSTYELVPPTGVSLKTKTDTPELRAIEKEIEELLAQAQNNSLDVQEMSLLFKKKTELQSLPQTPKNQEELRKLNAEMAKHVVAVKTLVEFKILMEKTGKNYYIVRNTIEHENAHANQAESLGAIHGGYSVLVSKNKDGFSYQPTALTKAPEEWDEKKKIETNIKIGSAPQAYGNRMSPTDEQQVERLRKQLENL